MADRVSYPFGTFYPWGPPDAQYQRERAVRAPGADADVSDGQPAPVVLVGACAPSGEQLPRGCGALIRSAQMAGWRVRATYALAEVAAHRHYLAAPSRVDGARWRDIAAELVETLAVRLASPRARGFILWRNRSFECAWLIVDGQMRRFGAREIGPFVRSITVDPSTTAQ
jgi:hypothetical protein